MTINSSDIVEKEMGPGEEPRWIGFPNARRSASDKGLYWFLLGIPWSAFAIYTEYRAFNAPPSWAEQHSMAIPLVVAGLAMLAQPFWHYWKARKTIYVVTERRLVVICRMAWWIIDSYFPPFDIEMRHSPDGSGTLFFLRDDYTYGERSPVKKKIELLAIPDVADVNDYIMQIKPETG